MATYLGVRHETFSPLSNDAWMISTLDIWNARQYKKQHVTMDTYFTTKVVTVTCAYKTEQQRSKGKYEGEADWISVFSAGLSCSIEPGKVPN